METLTAEVEPREASRHRRIQPRHTRRLSRFLPEAGISRKQAKSKMRFQVKSIALAANGNPPKSPMRVLLRNSKSMKFLGAGDRWTKNPNQARDFRNGWWATVHAFTKNPRHLVIEYEFGNDRYNLYIPVLGHQPI
jgi:hypothetical protein